MAKGKCICPPSVPGWVVSFADLMTLLFAAFVVLYALKKDGIGEEVKKVEVTAAAIRDAFNEVPDDIPMEKTSKPTPNAKAVFEYVRAEMLRKPRIQRFKVQNSVYNILDRDYRRIEELIKMVISPPKKESKDVGPAVSIHREDDGIRLRLMASHFYKPGEYRVERQALERLRKIGSLLKDLGKTITIEGHDDSGPPVGNFSKWELSSLRATYMVKFFINELGLPPDKIRGAAYGDAKPLSTNDTPEGRAMNRRMEIKLHYD